MKSYETKKVNNNLVCDEDLVCGSPLTLQDDMQSFLYHNVGQLNSGWIPYNTDSGDVEYLFINVENVTSDTLDITRIKNDIIVDIPNVYGAKLDFNAETGKLSLIGRENKELSFVELSLGKSLINIESDDVAHTITFTFSNSEAVVINLVDVLGDALTIEGITDNRITTEEDNDGAVLKVLEDNAYVNGLPLYPDLHTEDGSSVVETLGNNEEVTYGTISSGTFTLEADAGNHGFCAVVVFKTWTDIPTIKFINESDKPISYIKENDIFLNTDERESTIPKEYLSTRCQYNLFILCNGRTIEVYMQEINL